MNKKSFYNSDLFTSTSNGWGACPVDFTTINEYKARVNAFFVLGLAVVYLSTGFWPVIAFLAVDFLLRAGEWAKYSPIGFLSNAVIKQFKIGSKPVDRAPKRFAARMGFAFVASILTLISFQLHMAAAWLTFVLCIFAALESFAGICTGCYVYSGLLLIRKKA